jgi:hypothetical protein
MQSISTKFRKIRSHPKGWIIITSILLFFSAAIGAGLWYWQTHKKQIIRNELEKAISKKSGGLYNVRYDGLELDEVAGFLSISNMNISYDSTRYISLETQEKAPPVLLNIHIPGITITGVKTPRALIKNEIVGRKLEIKNPVFELIYTHSGKDSLRNAPTKEVYEQILSNLDLIQIDSVLITGAQITTRNLKTGKKSIQLQNISLTLVDVKVDSTGNADSTRFFFAKEINAACEKLTWSSASKLYNYRADSISISSVNRELYVKHFKIDPTLNEEAFVKAIPTQDDRFDFSFNNIRLRNIDMQQLFQESILADSMLIGSASFKVYRDLAIPRDTKNRVGFYPQQVIQRIPLTFEFKKVIVPNAFIEYKERNNITRQSGRVQFNKVYATISNFTNNRKSIAVNNIMKADLSSMFLNKTPLKVTWLFYLRHPKGRFDVKGVAGAIDATQLNSLTVPMAPARMKEGHINGLEFNLQGNDYGMDGSVKFLYENLKVEMLEKDKGKTNLDKKSLTSFMANFMIKNSNPKKKEDIRIAQVHNDRDINHSIFYVTWKTIFKGIRVSAGLNK